MKKYFFTFILLCLTSAIGYAQKAKKSADVAAIKSMCGCFEITFEFAETFSPDTAYRFHENYRASGLEWVVLDEETPERLVLQHLLIINDSTVIKHWRQDWLYENTELFRYDRDQRWVRTRLPKSSVRGQWTQKVFQVDDSPRYEGTASWVHVDGRHFWESRADAPLPRREFTKRGDYNVLARGNRHEITAQGWLHEQNNDKVVRTDAGDRLLAQERGWNPYVRVPDSRCQAAKSWWSQHRDFWTAVRKAWTQVFDENEQLTLRKKVAGKTLWEALTAARPEETGDIIRQYIEPAGQQADSGK